MFGIEIFDPKTIWVNLTNIALGLVTLIACAIVAWGVASELYERAKKRVRTTADDHSFAIPELGLTMADGGKKVDEPAGKAKK